MALLVGCGRPPPLGQAGHGRSGAPTLPSLSGERTGAALGDAAQGS